VTPSIRADASAASLRSALLQLENVQDVQVRRCDEQGDAMGTAWFSSCPYLAEGGYTYQIVFYPTAATVYDSVQGGTLTTTGKFESCPYVCFKPVGEDVVSDDEVWLRPIPAKVMEHWIPLWCEEIKEKYKQDQERAKRLIGESAPGGYKTVLKWEDSMISGPKLEIQQLGIGKRGMVILKEKLKSIRENPPTQPKGGAKVAAAAPAAAISKGGQTKLAAGLMMRGKGMASSSADNESEQSDLTTVPQARTIKIGASATTKTFEADGVLYATFLA
jgi:hypothetical protein